MTARQKVQFGYAVIALITAVYLLLVGLGCALPNAHGVMDPLAPCVEQFYPRVALFLFTAVSGVLALISLE